MELFRVIALTRSLPRSSQRHCRPTSPVHPTARRGESRRFRGACGTIRSSDCLPRVVPRFALRLSRLLSRCHTETRQALLGSRSDLPCRAVRKHLGATGEWMRLRLHSADSTLPRLWPTSSSSGSPPLTTARQFSSCPSDSASRRTPCPPRLVSGPARHYPRSLGYGPLHLGTRGTSTLPIRALPSAHYDPIRLPPTLCWTSASTLYQQSPPHSLKQGRERVSPVDALSLPTCRP